MKRFFEPQCWLIHSPILLLTLCLFLLHHGQARAQCTTVSAISQDFDNTTIGAVPACWGRSGSNLGVYNGNRITGTGRSLRFTSSGGDVSEVIVQEVDLVRGKQLSLWLRNNSATVRNVDIYLSNSAAASVDGTAAFIQRIPVPFIDPQNPVSWHQTDIDFTNLPTSLDGHKYIRIRFLGVAGETSNVQLDDFILSEPNLAPTNITLSNFEVAENLPAGTVVGDLETVDANTTDTHTYSFSLGGDNFEVVNEQLVTKVSLNHEAGSPLPVTLTSTDPAGESVTIGFNITVTDINEDPTDITLSSTIAIENQPIGSYIGRLFVVDEDQGDTHTYTISSALFSTSGNDLVSNVIFDFEDVNTYNISITATDAAGVQVTRDFTISVGDVNEAPFNLQLSNSSIDEELPAGSLVGIISADDPDANNVVSFELADETDFTITQGNQLVTSRVLDFETQSNFTVQITAADQDFTSITEDFVITVNDINEPANSAPTDISLSNSTVNENAPAGTVVGTLSTTDPDPNDTHNYTITNTGTPFNLNGDQLRTTQVFDFETQDSYAITVTTNDGRGGVYTKTFTITVNDLNENAAPSDILLSNSSVDEESPIGTLIGTLTTTDADAADTHTYTLSGTTAFAINDAALELAEVPDFETQASYQLTITTDDGNGGTFSKAFTISINDLDELVLGVEEELTQIAIYPNPSRGQIRINTQGQPFELSIRNSQGQLARAREQIINQHVIDLQLPAGIYLLQIRQNDQVLTRRLIITD